MSGLEQYRKATSRERFFDGMNRDVTARTGSLVV